MDEEVDMLTEKIKEIYISKHIIDMKLQMEEVDKINDTLFNYLESKIKIKSIFGLTSFEELFPFYKNLSYDNQIIMIVTLNEFYFSNANNFNKFGKSILEDIIEEMEDDDSDYVMDDIELMNQIQEDNYLDQEWDLYIDNISD